MFFFNGGGNFNNNGISSYRREAFKATAWSDNKANNRYKLTFVLHGDDDGPQARTIELFLADTLIYTYKTKIPAGTTNVYLYVGIGYPRGVSGYVAALNACR